MATNSLTLNSLSFVHKDEQLSCHLLTQKVPRAVKLSEDDLPFFIAYLSLPADTDVLYTTFDENAEGAMPVTLHTNKSTVSESQPCWSISFLKLYYTHSILRHFRKLKLPVKLNFVGDMEVWVLDKSPYKQCNGYKVFQLRVQFEGATEKPELLVSFCGLSSVHQEPITSPIMQKLSPDDFNWVLFDNRHYKYTELPDYVRRNPDKVFPCLTKSLKRALAIPQPAPDKSNKYIRYWNEISIFKDRFVLSEGIYRIMSFPSTEWAKTPSKRLEEGQSTLSSLLFGNGGVDTDPYAGIKKFGPKELTPQDTKTVFFFICRNADKLMAKTVFDYLSGSKQGFSGLSRFVNINFLTEKGWSIYFDNKEDPLPEIIAQLNARKLNATTRYVALYLSPFGKWTENESNKAIYYRLKEELLHRGIVSQVIEVEKTWGLYRVEENSKAVLSDSFVYSLPNIAIALLAKLGGTPWSLKHNDINELVIGISAFKCQSQDKKYLGSAFSFSNEGKFYGFDCFRSDQIAELAGSILMAVKQYCHENKSLQRLVIHFYKSLSKRELAPIEKGLAELGLHIPVIVVSINKTLSEDVLGFDLSQSALMPFTGTYLPIGHNQYLLYNSGFLQGKTYNSREGYPFPLKLAIKNYPTQSTESNQVEEATVPELLQQICQFSQLYWKSVSKQSLPVTLKYPEMLAQIVPHFQHAELPQTGKETLWFL